MEKHFCVACGKEFEASSNLVRYCPECKDKKAKAQKEKQKKYAKERNTKLGLSNISIYKKDKEILAKLAKEKNVMMAEIIKEILSKK